MRPKNRVKPFYFRDLSKEQVVDIVNEKLPISLKFNESLVNRIYERYPLLSKGEIAILVTLIFESFREFLILGKVMNFNKVFFDTKLLFIKKEGNKFNTKVKICIPAAMKSF